ncbi:MAG: MlaD family protein [candidate division WOR-3 bacterium]|nr:MlaD family protein [candidate division WOR-3 bacterium]
MTRSKPIVVIIFVLIIIALIVFSYLYLSGYYHHLSGYQSEVYFDQISGLKIGSPVYVRGMEKGKVTQIELIENGKKVKVVFTLDKKILLTEDTKFAIRSLSYFGTDRILMVTPGSGPLANKNTKFYGTNEVLELEEFFLKFNNLVTKLESIPITEQIRSIKTEITSAMQSLSQKFPAPIAELSQQLSILNSKLDSLRMIMQTDGTIKKLITSDELYLELRQTNQKLKELIEDIKTNPQKYLQIKMF